MAKSLELLNTERENFQGVLSDLIRRAKNSEGVIFVYSYYNKKSFKRKKLLAHTSLRVPRGGAVGERVFSATSPLSKASINWAVRIEGQANPLKKKFTNKQDAINYAKLLVKKRPDVKQIEVLD